MLRTSFERIAAEFLDAKLQKFSGNQLAEFIRRDLPLHAANALPKDFDDLLLVGSAGQGQWAHVPWLSLFDPLVTKSAMTGYYVVYLFDAEMERLYLSLNQGTTAVYHEFGPRMGRQVLRDRAELMRMRVSDGAGSFTAEPINLLSDGSLALGYEAGHALGTSYRLAQLPSEDEMQADAVHMLKLYRTLTFRGGITPADTLLETAGTKEIEEARRYTASARVERNPRVRKEVLKHKQPVCEACGLDPSAHYGLASRLPPERMPVDIHHLMPLSSLQEGERVKYRVPDDFAVLCPTCHRVVHLLDDPTDLEALRKCLKFGRIADLM